MRHTCDPVVYSQQVFDNKYAHRHDHATRALGCTMNRANDGRLVEWRVRAFIPYIVWMDARHHPLGRYCGEWPTPRYHGVVIVIHAHPLNHQRIQYMLEVLGIRLVAQLHTLGIVFIVGKNR